LEKPAESSAVASSETPVLTTRESGVAQLSNAIEGDADSGKPGDGAAQSFGAPGGGACPTERSDAVQSTSQTTSDAGDSRTPVLISEPKEAASSVAGQNAEAASGASQQALASTLAKRVTSSSSRAQQLSRVVTRSKHAQLVAEG
jgi:hypothetical protein